MMSKCTLSPVFISSTCRTACSQRMGYKQQYMTSAVFSSYLNFNSSRFSTPISSRYRPAVSARALYDLKVDSNIVGQRRSTLFKGSSSSIPRFRPDGRSSFHSSSASYSTSYATESIMYPNTWKSHSDIEIEQIVLPCSGDRINVIWSDIDDISSPSSPSSTSSSFPFVWLRDNCRCPQCFNPDSKSRTLSFNYLDVGSKVSTVSLADDHKSITITWKDGHVSIYPARFLRCNVFSELEHEPLTDINLELWDASKYRDHLRMFDFNDLLNDDRTRYELLMKVKVFGLAVIENAPLKIGQLNRLAESFGYLLPCNYGETFQVKSKMNPSNAAYLSGTLALHTDLSYCINPPGIQMLHCIKQADLEGGDNTLVDGFKIADDVRMTEPDIFDVLTKSTIEFFDSATDSVGEFFNHSRHRVIRLNSKNEVDRIVFSDHGRSAVNRMPLDDVIMTYKALTSFASRLYDPKNIFEYKMKDGDILMMDNYRVFHGRKGFTVRSGSSRHLEGGYLEWDNVMSKLRILHRDFGGM